MPFLGGKTGFFQFKTKKRRSTKTKKNKTHKTNKQGLGPSEVALRATSLDPQKKEKKNKKTNKYSKMSFSVISQDFLFFWWVSKSSLF